MDILTFFALPVATFILAFVLEKIIRVPILTALTFFAIYLVVAFTAFDASFLVFAIIYTLIAYIAALIAEFIYTNCSFGGLNCNCCNSNEEDINLSDEAVESIAERVADILRNRNNCRRMM